MASAWRPATELESRMHSALLAGDQEGYFSLLAEAELVIPVPPDLLDDVLANETQPTWPTREEDGRTHVLAFTSAAAMRACIGPAYQHFMKLKFSDAAETWPDTRWWLAINPGLPVAARLPSWFIKQVSEGDTRPPQVGTPAPHHAAPAPQLTQTLPDAQVAAPTQAPQSTQVPPSAPDSEATEATPATPEVPEVPPAAPGTADPYSAQAPQAVQDAHPTRSGAAAQAPTDAAVPHDPEAAQGVREVRADHGRGVGAPQDAQSAEAPAAQAAGIPQDAEDVQAGQGAHAVHPGQAAHAAQAAESQEGAQDVPAPGTEDEQPAREAGTHHAGVPQGPEGTQGAGVPQDVEPAQAGQGAHVEFLPANDVERELLRASAQGDQDAFVKTLATAEVLLPVPEEMDYTLRPGRPGFPWQTGELDGTTVIPLFTSAERLHDGGAVGEYIKLPFTSVVRYWPERSWGLAVNSGTPVGAALSGEELPGLSEWADQLAAQRRAENFEPQNDVEQRLFDAAVRRDVDAFYKVLLAAQVLVPAEPETPWGIRPDDPEFPWQPVPVHGTNSIQVFTSLKWMHEAIGSSRFVMPGFLDGASAWPDTAWTLVINPGTPIVATLPGEQVQALAGSPRPLAAAPEPEPAAEPAEDDFEPGNRIDQELYEAAVSGDTDAFLRVLLAANVLVPIPADAPLEVTPIQPEFRWEAAMREAESVQVFTSLVRLREVLPQSRFVYADFRELIGSWPRADWAMLLNPGTRIGASLRGDQVQALSEWAVRVGLIRPRDPVPEPAFRQPVAEVTAAAPEPEQAVTTPGPSQDSSGQGGDPRQAVVMQKVLPHGHVGWYLEQGYDRVGGFVHPISDVSELQTPGQLYSALGLLYEDSPFTPADDGVYVIRWPAYCTNLYRIPFGGSTEEELRAWGDAGWVLERPPFLGTGFAPGSAGSIREYKVESVRLPYGAEMYYLEQDRSEQFVAMYDPDRSAWLRPDTPAAETQAADEDPGWNDRAEAAQ